MFVGALMSFQCYLEERYFWPDMKRYPWKMLLFSFPLFNVFANYLVPYFKLSRTDSLIQNPNALYYAIN